MTNSGHAAHGAAAGGRAAPTFEVADEGQERQRSHACLPESHGHAASSIAEYGPTGGAWPARGATSAWVSAKSAYLFGRKRLANEFYRVLTGKGPEWGRSLIRPEATGYGSCLRRGNG